MKNTFFAGIIAASLCVLMCASAPAMAQGGYGYGDDNHHDNEFHGELRWEGDVDNVVFLLIHDDQVQIRDVEGKPPRHIEANLQGRLSTHHHTHLVLKSWYGRGTVDIANEPDRDNGYTAVVHISDPQPGKGHYSIDLVW